MKSMALRYRVLIVLGVLALSTALIFVDISNIKSPKFKPETNVKLGLDLRGGSYLVMQVQTQAAVADEVKTVVARIEKDLRDKKIFRPELDAPAAPGQPPAQGVILEGDNSFVVHLPSAEGVDEAMKTIDLFARSWIRETVEAGRRFRVSMPTPLQSQIRDAAVNASLETIRKRVSEYGVAEEVINRQGSFGGAVSDRIVLLLPGVENPERVKDLIKTQAKLEWKEMTYPPGVVGDMFAAPSSVQELAQMFGGALPPDTEAYPQPTGVPGSDGKEVLKKDEAGDDKFMSGINFYVKGVEGKVPSGK